MSCLGRAGAIQAGSIHGKSRERNKKPENGEEESGAARGWPGPALPWGSLPAGSVRLNAAPGGTNLEFLEGLWHGGVACVRDLLHPCPVLIPLFSKHPGNICFLFCLKRLCVPQTAAFGFLQPQESKKPKVFVSLVVG